MSQGLDCLVYSGNKAVVYTHGFCAVIKGVRAGIANAKKFASRPTFPSCCNDFAFKKLKLNDKRVFFPGSVCISKHSPVLGRSAVWALSLRSPDRLLTCLKLSRGSWKALLPGPSLYTHEHRSDLPVSQ